ncbi:HypC/HybG/HupF family hydrogenase formation chaperone [Corynebacterium aquilae]|uniref:Hydrogenase assembly protein HupF n=1 Tax=Corynebacterium aquilae DSM 44791 TaxID=1431546 RepID=A0A1L7CDV2_9CORY|nr:HypC/HybG/HupF family hydrogenase formation chaperone [Corynebacterium aquilae]APT84019.1 hypothetical protein CAQU_01845 [Corynebacterium aquilae DSM 44791]
MCLGIPARVVDVGMPPLVPGQVDVAGQVRSINLGYLPEAEVGDWVLIQNGFAVHLITADEARETLEAIEDHQLFDVTVLPGSPRQAAQES